MLTIYLDDSGSYPDTTYVAIAGAVGPEVEWARLTIAWQAALQRKNITAFHRTTCESLRGDFEGWSKPDRDAFVDELINIFIDHQSLWGVGAIVSRRDYNEYVPYELRKAVGKPYLMCLEGSFSRVGGIPGIDANEKWGVIFERSDEYQAKARELFYKLVKKPQWKDRLISFTDAPKEMFTPLQVADLIAWELRNYWHKLWHTFDAAPAGLARLTATERCRFTLFDRDGIHQLLGELASQRLSR